MVYSKLPWRPFLRHQAWSWTTLRRGNVFLLRLQTFFIFVTFLHFLTFFIFIWTFFTCMLRASRTSFFKVPFPLENSGPVVFEPKKPCIPRSYSSPNPKPAHLRFIRFCRGDPCKNGWTASDVMINTHTSRHSVCSNSPHLALFVVVVLAMRAKNYNRTTQCKFQ